MYHQNVANPVFHKKDIDTETIFKLWDLRWSQMESFEAIWDFQ